MEYYFRKFKIIPILATALPCGTDNGNANLLWLILMGDRKAHESVRAVVLYREFKGCSAVQRV